MNVHIDKVDGEISALRITTMNDDGETVIELQVTTMLDGLRIVTNGKIFDPFTFAGSYGANILPR